MTNELKDRVSKIRSSEVPNGYKKTVCGIIPDEWNICKFKQKFTRLKNKNCEGNSNILTISAQYGLINQEEFFKKEVASDDKSNYYLLNKGDFAYNKSYSNGYPYGAIKPLTRYEKGIVSPLYICFSPADDSFCTDYYTHYFEFGLLNKEIHAIAQEGARNHGLLNVSVDDFFNTNILCPPLPEQQKIAEILSTQDKVIDLIQNQIEELKKLKKAYLQKMFPQKGSLFPEIRFKGFTDAWEQRELSELIIEYKETVDSECDLPVLTSSKTEGVVFQEEHFGRKQQHDITGYNILPRGYCTYRNRSDGVDFTFNINKCCDKGIISKFYPVFYGNNSDVFFISLVLNHSEEVVHEIGYTCTGTGQKVLSFLDLQKMHITVPSYDEQKKIASYFEQLDTLITLHQRKLEQEQQKKKALMQLLLTGIVRVKV